MDENKDTTINQSIHNPPKPSFFSRHKVAIIVLVLLFLFVIVPLTSFFAFLAAIINSTPDNKGGTVLSGSGANKVAVINVDGEIVEKDSGGDITGLSTDTFSARKLSQMLHDIKQDPSVKVLVLRVDSPGGSTAASDEIYQDLLAYKKQTGNKIVAYFSDEAASGAYFISMAADKIVANPSTITGSIGVIVDYLNFGGLADKYGVKEVVYKSGPHKDIVSQFRLPTDDEQSIMQNMVQDVFDNFVQAVKNGRNMPEDKVRSLADGRVYSAQQAVSDGLVDSMGTFDDAVTEAKNTAGLKEATVVEYGQPGVLDFLAGNIAQKINLAILPGIGGFSSLFVMNQSQNFQILYMFKP